MPRLFLGQRLFDAAMVPLTLLRREALFASLLNTSGVRADEHAAPFAQLARVLRGGGTLFVIEIARPTTRWARLAFGWHSCVRAALPEARLRELARDAGFTCIATAATAPWVRWLRATKP